MRAHLHSGIMSLFIAGLIGGCVVPVSETDESAEFGEQIGQAEQAATQAQKDWWKGLWQSTRNARIVGRAYLDYNESSPKYVGLNCKEWARKVVQDASQGVVWLPGTTGGGYGWKWEDTSTYVQSLGTTLDGIWAGDIVQMNTASGPHTAIVFWKSQTTIWWIDSNWSSPPDLKVRLREQSIADFLNKVKFGSQYRYTAYRVIGG